MAEVLLRARDLVVRTGTFAVEVARLEMAPGQIVCVLGPNGAGKSTLALALAGLQPASTGTVEVDGGVGFLPQRPVLFSGTVRRNVELPLRLRGVPRAAARERAGEVLEAVGAAGLSHRRARSLSGGEARRVAVARLLAPDPDLLILDEPFGGLDASARERLLAAVGRVLRSGARAADTPRGVVLVTHDREEAMALADRVLVLVDGRVIQEGTVTEVFTRPAGQTVAELVGAENVLEGRIVAVEADVVRVRCGGLELSAAAEGRVGDRVLATVRPEALVLYGGEAPAEHSARTLLRADVAGLEPRPHLVRVLLDVGELTLVATVAPATVDDMRLGSRREVYVGIKATAVHLVPRGV